MIKQSFSKMEEKRAQIEPAIAFKSVGDLTDG